MTNKPSSLRRSGSSFFKRTSQKHKVQRDSKRGSRLETLEKRELLAAEIIEAHAVFAQGTPQDVVDEWNQRFDPPGGAQNGSSDQSLINPQPLDFGPGVRWESTAFSATISPNQGDPTRVTWGIVPDGTDIVDPNTNAVEAPSDLIAFLDSIYGGDTEPIVANKPWFPLFEQMYDSISQDTGIEFVYEPNDDGVPVAINSPILVGSLGTRPDLRISGRPI